MSNVVRTAGVEGSFNYTLSQVPAEVPTLTIYSDAARTVVAVATAPLTATANPAVFTAVYPATLAAGTYFLSFSVVMTTGQPAFIDNNDTLELQAVSGTTGENQWVSGASLASDPRLNDVALPAGVTFDDCALSATEYLYKRTGRRFRTHTTTVRPNVANVCGCSVEDCWSSRELSLPGPVAPESVVVTIEGVTLPPSAYTLYDRHLLVRQDGGFWPWCSHLSQPTNLAWSITFTRGESPGMDGILACRELAIHVAIALSGKPSKLPARATGVQRRGLSMNLLRGLKSTGIPLVDDYVSSTNPNGLTGRGSVMSPDTIRLSSS